MILYINDLEVSQLIREAEWDDMAENALEQYDPPRNLFVKAVAFQLFAAAGEPVPENAIFEPVVWRRDDDQARVAITTTPGEVPNE